MKFDRREFLLASLAATAAACNPSSQQPPASRPPTASDLGIPGPYPGVVVAVRDPGTIISGTYQAQPVRAVMEKGMLQLTGADNWADAWRRFVQPGEVIGIKLNAAGTPHCVSSPYVLRAIIDGLEKAGIRRQDIVVYDRYFKRFREVFSQWLPDKVRSMGASEVFLNIQLDMEGYDPDVYLELPLTHPDYFSEYRPDDPHIRRSYVAKFLTREVDKLINLSCLKHHQSAGVTLALKNLSHGLVNNVNRSHVNSTANACGLFIPAVVDLPIIRQKVVLNILDGVRGAYHGGPGAKTEKYLWEHQTMYFATDPVALDHIGWKEIDKKRAEMGRDPIALMKPDEDSQWLNGQVEHIELAGNMGLGVFDEEKIQLRQFDLSV